MIKVTMDHRSNAAICELDGNLIQVMAEFSGIARLIEEGLREHDGTAGDIFAKWLTLDVPGSFRDQMRKVLSKDRTGKDGVTIRIDAEELRKQAEEDQDGD